MSVTAPQGFTAAAVAAAIKPNTTRLDVALVASEIPATLGAVFTLNEVKAAPVRWSQKVQRGGGSVRAVLLNAGNANACWGKGAAVVSRRSAQATAKALGCSAQEIMVASTGPIGVPLPLDNLLDAVPKAAAALQGSKQAAHGAAQAIMTTDLQPKQAVAAARVGQRVYKVGGMAKGSGMIHPNMATMLSVITCDAPLSRSQAQRLLEAAVARSFNTISVDGDTSTNDCVFLLCNGAAGGKVAARSKAEATLAAALQTVCDALAEAIAVDGEGAQKLIVMHVVGARSDAQAAIIARTIISSPLVKTAVAGGDPNWGRVLMAAGRAGVPLRQEQLSLRIGRHQVAKNGEAVPAAEAPAAKTMQGKRVEMELTVGGGRGTATAKGCDLTHGYVDINAHYRT